MDQRYEPDRPDPGVAPAPGQLSDRDRWRVLGVLLAVIFMSLVGVSIVNVALPSIQSGLGAGQSAMQWVLSGYALTFGVILVAAGRAGDILGRGGFFLVGVGVFTLASVGAGLAPDTRWLNAARLLQGIGSGLLNPQGLGMIQQYFRGAERGRAFGLLGTAVGFSVAIGPVLGGVLIQFGGHDLGWRLTFLVNVPIGIAAILLGLAWFPKPLFRPAPAGVWRALDPVGAALLGLAILAILWPFMQAGETALAWGLLPAGAVMLWAWVAWERRQTRLGQSPMVDLRIFRTRSFTNGSIVMTLYFMGMTSIWVLVALYVQQGVGKSAFASGLIGIPAALLSAWAANWAGRRVGRWGRAIVSWGLVLALVGLALSIAVVVLGQTHGVSVWWLLLTLSFLGLAQGAVISPNQTLTLEEVPLEYAGSSGAVMQTGQRIGTSVGIAIITAAVFAVLAVSDWTVAVAAGFALIGLVILAALVVAVRDQRRRARG